MDWRTPCETPVWLRQPLVTLVAIAVTVLLLQGVAAQNPSSQVFNAGIAEELGCKVINAARPGTLRHELTSGLLAIPRRVDWHVLMYVFNGAYDAYK
jgi:hypothetical protein